VNYFPPSPIPVWPNYSGSGTPIKEYIFRRENVAPGINLDAARARMRSQVYRNGEPMVCLSCAATTDPHGNLPCGH
jgi:hypothetical protein